MSNETEELPNSDLKFVDITTHDITSDGTITVSTLVALSQIETNDIMIKLAKGNTADILDTGWYSEYNDGAAKYRGCAYDASASKFVFFNSTTDPSATIGTDYTLLDVTVKDIVSTNMTGTLQTAAQPNITSVGTLTSLALAGAISGVTTLTATTLAGTLSTAAQPNITSVGTLTSLTLAGAITAPAGTISTPSYSFTTDTDTGMYLSGANIVGLVAGGASRLLVSSTSIRSTLPIIAVTGTASAPSYCFSGDTDTGMYSDPSTDVVGLTTNGTSRLLINTASITTTLPFLASAGSVSAPSYSFSSSTGSGMYYTGTANTIALATGGTARLTLNTASITTTLPSLNPNGTVSAPSYSFSSSTGSGMYLGSGFVGISYTGSDIFSAYPTETITKGRCRADSFYFRLDPNTGISNDNPSEFHFYGGGSVKAVIQNNGFIRASGGFHGFDGSVGTPAFTFNSDYSTGMFLGPAYLGFSYNGSLMFDITNAGAYTIGYSRADSFDFRNDNQSGMYLYSGPPSSDVRIRCAGTNCASFRSGKLIAFKNNSTAVPTISWNHDLTTGFNSWLAGGINMVCGGTERVQVGTSFIIPGYTNGISNGLSNYAWAACYSYGYYSPSDRRLKSDIVDCDLGLDFINAIRPVQYRWNDRVRTHRGFISQEIKEVCDQLNIAGENSNNIGFWGDNSINTPERTPEIPPDDQQSIVYTEFIPILTKAIQELSRRVEALENK